MRLWRTALSREALIGGLTVLFVGVFASSALGAATVSVSGGELRVDDGQNTTNSIIASGTAAGVYRIQDDLGRPFAPVECSQPTPAAVQCSFPGLSSWRIDLNEGNPASGLLEGAFVHGSPVPVFLNGGAHVDRLGLVDNASTGTTVPAGSVVDGGDDSDIIDFTYPTGDSLAGGGRQVGGLGNDQLIGGTGPDLLDGGPGSDQLDDAGGADELLGGPGRDRIVAQDKVRDAVIDCGPGKDAVFIDKKKPKDPKPKGCEEVIKKRITSDDVGNR